uniref:Uncharacterized protein MANES_16G087200 n=1 Tax=Rhizophora mucronata TaxID=61149 RepID=A0A2P2KXU9_RHIMU
MDESGAAIWNTTSAPSMALSTWALSRRSAET